MIAIVVISTLSLTFPQPIRGQTAVVDDIAVWTVKRVVRDAQENKKLKTKIKYSESLLEKEYDTKGNLRWEDKKSKTIEGGRKSQISGFEIDLYDILVDTYNFKLAEIDNSSGLDVVDNKVYVVIDFYPKTGLKYKNLADRFTYRLEGRMFVDVQGENYYVHKFEARIPKEFSFTYWWGIIPIPITIKSFGFTLVQERITIENIIVEKYIDATVIFDSIRDGRREYRYDYGNFQYKK